MKKNKKILFLTFIFLSLFIFNGCTKEKPIIDNEDKALEVGEYKIEKKENEILVTTFDGTATNSTKYLFKDNSLISITITQKYTNKELAKTSYNTLIKEPEITKQYIDIKLNNDIISFKAKDDMLVAYVGMTFDSIYELLNNTYKDKLQK